MSAQPLSLTDTEIDALPAEELLRWAHAEFGEGLCLSCSWQKQSSVLVHMVSELDLPIDVIELDTQLFFRESYETRDRLLERYPVNLVRPEVITIAEQHRREGPNLWERDPDHCCEIRKVEPLKRAKQGLDAWISGRKAFQSVTRQNLPRFEIEDGRLKINPLGDWTKQDLEAYFAAHDLPRHPLEAQGYLSVGCQPCTSTVAPGEDPRAGRWRGWDKTECGIHSPAGVPGGDEGELPPGYEPAF